MRVCVRQHLLLMASAIVVAGVLAQGAPGGAAAAVVRPVVTKSADGLFTWNGLPDPAVIDTAAGLYLTWVTSPLPLGRSPEHEELAHISTSTGEVMARRAIDGRVAGAVKAGHWLMVTVTSSGEELLRLNPTTLAEDGNWRIGHTGLLGPGASSVVRTVAGVWVTGGDRLVRVTARRGKIVTSITLPGVAHSDLATNDAGSILLVGEANEEGLGHIQRRNPMTGQLIATSSQIGGVVNPFLTSVTGGDFWISEATGMMGYVRLYHLTDLSPIGSACETGARTETCVVGTNGIAARVRDGVLFVTQVDGGPAHNFCAEPDGHFLGTLPIPTTDSLLAIGQKVLFLLGPLAGRTQVETVTEVVIPSACAGGH